MERVGRAYAVVGHALQQNEVIPYSPQIGQAAKSITQVLNGQITSIEFEANNEVATVMTNDLVREPARLLGAWGAIEGTVETLTSRRRLGFTLYAALNDKAVSCHLTPEQTELIRPAWGHHVLERGWINRDPASGRPITIKPVGRCQSRTGGVERSWMARWAKAP